MQENIQKYEYFLDNHFFTDIDGEEIQKGRIKVFLAVSEKNSVFELDFKLSGIAIIPCDRCLDDMEYPIDTTSHLIVKLGKDYAEESDEIVVIPESEGAINLAWFLYEFVALAIPIKHVHAPGKCNKKMTSTLKKHTAKSNGEDDDSLDMDVDDVIITDDEENDVKTDSRWDVLKNFNENE
jgi:uncharacterized metal-binding protein YceD (DUF177 family)